MPKPTLNPGEREIAAYRANWSQDYRALGGHLLLTDQRVVFYPTRLDAAIGGDTWECNLRAITDVGLTERGANPFNGSLRRRLRIESGGAVELFVVNKAASIVTAIRTAAGR